jgi:hypothetical protein
MLKLSSYHTVYQISLILFEQYPFTTVIPNLGVWVPPESDYARDASKGLTGGAGSAGIVLCVSWFVDYLIIASKSLTLY